ncbi:capsular biosynthesis protein [Anaerobacillus sp. CMMVII]|uniref:YveK family protein n=1 Tax=Anaerobacillus sp. CMMVII TaxID=2755588 RepID=UPI0021B7CA45|nr:capsular biosynthesis protein [Anaerobacillus sp. CMMVII]MCT8139006.1 capsular biosynthesis protein [Anaerobacillus sp. CMMVII]
MAKEINIREIFLIIKRRFWIIVILTVLATVAGYFQNSSSSVTLLYQSSSRIIVGANSDYMKTLIVIMRDPVIMEKVANELNLSRSADALARQLNVDSINSSQVVRITVTDTDPEIAADIANTTATIFKNEIGNIVNFNDVSYLSEAQPSYYPINGGNSSNRSVYIAGGLGFVLAIGFVFLLHSLDDSITSRRDIEDVIGLTVLGKVSKMNKRNLKKKKQKQKEPDIEYRGEMLDLKKTY